MMRSYSYVKHVNKTTFRKVHLRILWQCTKQESGISLFTLFVYAQNPKLVHVNIKRNTRSP